MRFICNKASLLLMPVGKHAFILSNLYSVNKHRGEGTRVLKNALEYVDSHNAEVMLWAQQYGDIHGMTNPELVSWYERFGFVVVQRIGSKTMMIRPCREKNMAYDETPS